MMKLVKRCVFIMLAMALILATPTAIFADEAYPLEAASLTYINPIYRDVITEEDLLQPGAMMLATDEVSYYTTAQSAGEAIRPDVVNRDQTIVVGYQTVEELDGNSLNQIVYEVFDVALEHTGVPTEGDYLLGQFGGWTCNMSGYYDGTAFYWTFSYVVTYYTTATQEQEMNTEVAKILASLDLEEASDYQKVKGIYDYICENITYDYDNYGDDSYLLKHTAYAALINKTSVCQGYAVLFYRMALELGVDARYITGMAYETEPHSWNIVKLEDMYYDLDATWDAGMDNYEYFLRCDRNFKDHSRDVEYTGIFYDLYPMSELDHISLTSKPEINIHPENVSVELGEIAAFHIEASGINLTYQWQWSPDGGITWKNSSKVTTGYNTDTLQVIATNERQGYQYRCIVTDTYGKNITSNTVALHINIKLGIVTQPVSKTVTVNSMVSFPVKAQGEGLIYQWQWSADGGKTWKNSSSITEGYNADTLKVRATAARNGYQYRCVITDKNMVSVTTNVATLKLKETITITAQPSNQSVSLNETATFTVSAEGEGLTYQWQWSHDGGNTWKNSSAVTIGYNTDTLCVQATVARNGYQYRCLVADKNGVNLLSETATLSLSGGTAILVQPSDQSAVVNSMVSFTLTAQGEGLKYQWQWSHDGGSTWKNSSAATIGYNTDTLCVQAIVARNGYQYRCVVTDQSGESLLSEVATLRLPGSTSITAQPNDQSVAADSMAVFMVKAEGEGLKYQWQWSYDGGSTWKNSSSATVGYNTDTLQVKATNARNGYQYRCIITDGAEVKFITRVVTLMVK